MKVSIITVVYNGADTLRDCIESVLGQTHPNLEYIVVDGASTDASPAIVKQFGAKIAAFISEPDRGIYDAMNKGLAAATGDVVGFLNADDLYAHPNVIANVVAALQTENTQAAYGDLVYVDRLHPDRVVRTWTAGRYRPGQFRQGWMPPHPTFFVKKRMYDEFGGFNLQLKSAADYELMLRFIHKQGIRLSYLPQVLVRMRTGGLSNASLRNRLRANREDRRAWLLNDLKPHPLTLWWKPLRKVAQFLRRSR